MKTPDRGQVLGGRPPPGGGLGTHVWGFLKRRWIMGVASGRGPAEAATVDDLEHLAHAQRISHVGSATLDLVHGNDRWSDELYRLIGVEPCSIPSRPEIFLQFVHPDDRDLIRHARIEAEDGQQGKPVEYRIIRPDGELRWLYRLSGTVSYAEDGRPVRAVVSVQDITARKQAEAALRQSQEQLGRSREHLTQAQRVGMVGSAEYDLTTGHHTWSDELYRLFGAEPGTLAPGFEQFLALVLPEDRPSILAVQAGTREGRPAPIFDFRIRRQDGALRWLRRQSDVLSYRDGKPSALIIAFQDITESKQAALDLAEREEQLRQSQEHLTIAQRVGTLGSAETDLISGKVYWSDEQFTLLGVPSGSIPATLPSLLSFVHPDDRDAVRAAITRALAGEDVAPIDFRVVRHDGQVRWVRRVQDFIEDASGAPLKLVATLQDITENKRMEEAVRISREHLTLAQRVGRIGSAEVDLVNRTVLWSDALFAVLGLDPKAAQPGRETFFALLHPEDRDLVAAHRAATLTGEATPPIEFRIIRPDGELRWLYHKVEVLFDATGKPVKLIGTDQDITELKQATFDLREREAELRNSQRHLALAQRIGKIGSVEIAAATKRSHWSDEMYALLGLDPAVAVPGPESLLAVTHPEDREEMRRRREHLSHGGVNIPYQFRVVRPDTGEVRWLQVQSGPANSEAGRPTTMVATFQDVTELRKAQIERGEIERQLMQAQKMEAVGNLTGGIAHDFNNLLTVILGRLDLAESELEDRPELREWIRICSRAARRGATLTRSMMAFARQQPLRPVAIDLALSIGDMVGLLQRTLGEGIEIKTVYATGLWRCEADPSQLQSALLNLALNARDAMPDGGRLAIDARNVRLDADYAMRNADVAPGHYVMMSVSDTGTGMPREVVDRAFEPFFTTKAVGKGSGLGLSMVYGFVKQSGGHVKIYSEVGFGTTIRLYLPRAKGDQPALMETAVEAETVPASNHETILVVEDDEDMRDLTAALLERLGYRPLYAADADSAILLFEQHADIALLLTDISLPGRMNGRNLAEHLQRSRPALKVLFMSGYSEDAVIHQGRLDPGVRLLQKPFQNDELATQVRAALEQIPL